MWYNLNYSIFKGDVMNVASYTYQTPSPNAVQVGKLDPSSVKQEEKFKESTQTKSATPMETPNETLMNAKNFQAAQTTGVAPTVTSQNSIDIYV